MKGFQSAALLLLLLLGCTKPAAETPIFAHRPVVKDSLSAAQALVEAEAPPSVPTTEVDPEQVSGLAHMVATSNAQTKELALEDIRTLGEGSLGTLAGLAARTDRPGPERIAAVELIAALGTPKAAGVLLKMCESAPESWIRAQAAWRLGTIPADWVVPRLVYRLKYEVDHETAIWIASTLAQRGSFAGQEALYNIRNQGQTPELRASAEQQLAAMAELAGASDLQELWDLWNFDDPQDKLLRKAPSPRLQQEVWQLISDLSGEHFQLRGVDDSRFILSRMGTWVIELLCEALHDEDVYVRVHVAQCLERMGARASRAGPALVQALNDPSLAPAAATALGEISYPLCEPILRDRLLSAESPHELRVACASALGRIGLSVSADALTTVLERESDPFDLRQRAAISLCQMDLGRAGAPFLLAALQDPRADRFGAEVALGAWLRGLEDERAKPISSAWDEIQPAPGMMPTVQEAESRLTTRRLLLEESLGDLLGDS